MIKLIAYYRKSTDTKDKQTLSLKDQKRVVREYAKKNDIEIIKEFSESFSAKKEGRPVFNEMVTFLKQGRVSGLIVYKLDRLTRNYGDFGTIIDLIECKNIQVWATDYGKYENNTVGKMMMGFVQIQSKAKIDGLSEDVKRSLDGKIKDGWWAGWAPLGYLNTDIRGKITGKSFTLEKQTYLENLGRQIVRIEVDPFIAPLIKKAFEIYAYQDVSLKKLCMIMHDEGLRNRAGNKISKGGIHQILVNPFYYGDMEWLGLIWEGKHQPIINKLLFETVQKRLRNNAQFTIKPNLDFLYKGLLKCGSCGMNITAEERERCQKNGNVHHYVYYHCTKSQGNCGQRHIEEKDLENQLSEMFKGFFLEDKQAEEIKIKLTELYDEDNKYQSIQEKALKTRLTKLQNEKKSIYKRMLMGDVDDKETYLEVKNDLQNEIRQVQEKLLKITDHSQNWFDQSSNLLYLATHAQELFLEGTKEEKQMLIRCVSSNLFLKDKKVEFSFNKPFEILSQTPKLNSLLLE